MRLHEAAACELESGLTNASTLTSSFWSGVLDDMWKDPATRRAILDRVDRIFWQFVWPAIRGRRWKILQVAWLKGLFELVFGEAPPDA